MNEAAEEFLRTHRQAVLATIRRDGRPQLSNVLAVYIDDRLWISITETRAKYKNIRRDPRVSVLVQGDNFWQYLAAGGITELIHLPEALPLLRRYYEIASGGPHPNWEEYDEAMRTDRRVIAAITLEDVRLYPPAG